MRIKVFRRVFEYKSRPFSILENFDAFELLVRHFGLLQQYVPLCIENHNICPQRKQTRTKPQKRDKGYVSDGTNDAASWKQFRLQLSSRKATGQQPATEGKTN